MKDTMMLGTALLLVLAGCTSVRTVDLAQDARPAYRITAVDGRQSYGSDVVRTSDSTWWTDAAGQRRVLASSQVAAVEDAPRPEGYRDWPEGVAEINTLARQRQARVTLADGRFYLADRLHVARDMSTWFDPDTDALMRVATSEVAKVVFVDHGKGAREGLVKGLAGGVLIGALMGIMGGDDPPCAEQDGWFCIEFTAEEKATVGAISLGLLGGLGGLINGAVVGSQDVYRLSRPTTLIEAKSAVESQAAP